MASIINSLSGDFIGSVINYDTSTRELDVFIPKLMPMITDGRKDMTIKTNMGNNNINIKYNENIIISSSIRVKAEDKNEPIPDLNSKVIVYFLEENVNWIYWDKFNPNGDYEVIEDEKYKKLNTISIGDISDEIYEDDNIIIELPEGFSVVKKSNPFGSDEKTKYFKIEKDTITENRVSELERLVGNPKKTTMVSDNNGKEKEKTTMASGLFRSLEKTNEEISSINFKLGCNGLRNVYKKIENFERYSPTIDYYLFNGDDYTVPPINEVTTIEEKTNILLTLQESGFDLYERLEEPAEPSGIYGKIFSLAMNLENLNLEIKKLKDENTGLRRELDELKINPIQEATITP